MLILHKNRSLLILCVSYGKQHLNFYSSKIRFEYSKLRNVQYYRVIELSLWILARQKYKWMNIGLLVAWGKPRSGFKSQHFLWSKHRNKKSAVLNIWQTYKYVNPHPRIYRLNSQDNLSYQVMIGKKITSGWN